MPEPSPYPGSAAERLEQFADDLRSRGHSVADGAAAVRWLTEGVERTRAGERWFDTSTQGPANRVFDDGVAADRLRAGHEGANELNREFRETVAELADRTEVLPDAPTVGLPDTPDGRAVTRLGLRDAEMREYLRWYGGPDPVQVQDAVACQYARDGRSDLDAAARNGQTVRLDPRLLADRHRMQERREAGELPTRAERDASTASSEGRSYIERMLNPEGQTQAMPERPRTDQAAQIKTALNGTDSRPEPPMDPSRTGIGSVPLSRPPRTRRTTDERGAEGQPKRRPDRGRTDGAR